jgi:luciferase family oxidoreductase group 1
VNDDVSVTALSVLDQSPVAAGSTPAAALHQTVALAQHTERLGYRRYWLAEHHDTASLAGSAPEVLTAHVASQTSSIRVGAGGVLLSHYRPLKVAETFRVLHALFPGRIDLGLGRADAGGPRVVSALDGQGNVPNEDEYRQRVASLIGLFDDTTIEVSTDAAVRAAPCGVPSPEVWILGSSAFGAVTAAELGLPFSYAHFVSPNYAPQILAAYRAHFRPSRRWPAPQANLAVSAICADTDAEAEWLARSDDIWHLTADGARRGPLLSAEAAAAFHPNELGEQLLVQRKRRRFVGAVDKVHRDLLALAAACAVDEFVVRTVCHNPVARAHSYQLLAEAFGIERR